MISKNRGFTLIEVLIVVAVLVALTAIGASLFKSTKERAHQTAAMSKMKALGTAFAAYTTDRNGNLPFEDATGTDDWHNAAKPENQEAWYNALPKQMGAPSVGELGLSNPAGLYDKSHPLYIPGAPYPGRSGSLGTPTFTVGMNSRLQRKDEGGIKKQGRMEQIQEPAKTVVLLERGMPKDKQTMPAQRGFDGSPKANPRAFAARHNQKGCLIFADGHAQLHAASDLLTPGGGVIFPQTAIVWTLNPDDDPN
jgi:prepilin-type N-terminal cleavage/methylation domain-containing protein